MKAFNVCFLITTVIGIARQACRYSLCLATLAICFGPAASSRAESNSIDSILKPPLMQAYGFAPQSNQADGRDLGDAELPLSSDPLFLISEMPLAPPAKPAVKPPSGPLFTGPIVIDKFLQMEMLSDGNQIHYEGGVRITATDAKTGKPTTLTADTVDYSPDSGIFTARGSVRLEREEGVFTGTSVAYNFASRLGYVADAQMESDYFRVSGRRIETQANGAIVIYDGVFTTCLRGQPDYKLKARKLTVYPNRYVSARHITFYAGRTPLITLQSYRRDLSVGGPASIVVPHYSVNEGVNFRFNDTPISRPHALLEYDIHANFIDLPEGFIGFQRDISRTRRDIRPLNSLLPILGDPLSGTLEQLHPPTYLEYSENRYAQSIAPRTAAYATIQNQQFVYNRVRNDLNISRFPEIGVRFLNVLGHNGPNAPAADQNQNGLVGVAPESFPNAPALLNVTAGLGYIRESPTNIDAGRFATQASLATQPLILGKRLSWRAALTNRLNAYSTGSLYETLSPEAEIDYLPTRTSVFDVGYRYVYAVGSTPFVFDRRDVRQEMRLQYQVSGPIAFGYLTKYDVERARFYDSEIAVVRNFDCMQVGLTYRMRSRSIGVVFNILPPLPDRARRRPLPLGGVPK